jgi:protein-S-isoprenylcysteine O-methyltransferase Ste14
MCAPYSAAVLPLGIVTIQKVAHNEEAQQMVPLFGEEYEEYRKSTPLFSKPVIFLLVAAYVYVLLGLRRAG